jgi:nucleotide-binding universal stress UspA family protein
MTGVTKISRVLVGVDFDEASAAALKFAGSLAAAWAAELTVFHSAVLTVPAYFTAAQFHELEAERVQSRATMADQIRVLAQQQIQGAINVVVGDGPPQDAMVRMAPAFDLVAVGTHRRHGPQRWWLGSVAEAVVRHSPRPVLVVPAGASVPDAQHAPAILAAGADEAADAWLDRLSTAVGGHVLRSSDLQHCTPDRLKQADLIVLSMPAGGSDAPFGPIAYVLKECVRPVLFVPSSKGTVEGSSS